MCLQAPFRGDYYHRDKLELSKLKTGEKRRISNRMGEGIVKSPR